MSCFYIITYIQMNIVNKICNLDDNDVSSKGFRYHIQWGLQRFELTQNRASLWCSIYLMHRESLWHLSLTKFLKQNYNSDHVFEIAMQN